MKTIEKLSESVEFVIACRPEDEFLAEGILDLEGEALLYAYSRIYDVLTLELH